eukprot:scaffold24235_cov93-Isochrysis_galbana.AAC.1
MRVQHSLEGARDDAQVVAARVGVVGLEPAVGDAHDWQVRVAHGLLHLAEREEGLVGQRLPRLQHAALLLGQGDHPLGAEQHDGARRDHRLQLRAAALLPLAHLLLPHLHLTHRRPVRRRPLNPRPAPTTLRRHLGRPAAAPRAPREAQHNGSAELHAALCSMLIRHHPPAARHQRQLARRSPARRGEALHRSAHRRPRRQPQRAATIGQQQADPTTDGVGAR